MDGEAEGVGVLGRERLDQPDFGLGHSLFLQHGARVGDEAFFETAVAEREVVNVMIKTIKPLLQKSTAAFMQQFGPLNA